VSAGVVGANTMMVASPPHSVLLYSFQTGSAAMYAMTGYQSSQLKAVNPKALGVEPLLLEAAGNKLMMRFRQHLQGAGVPLDLEGGNNIMYAWSPFNYPATHQVQGVVKVSWLEGTAVKAPLGRGGAVVPGYILMLLPLLGGIITLTPLRKSVLGRLLLQKRLATITRLPTWFNFLSGGWIPALQNLKWGEFLMILLYLGVHAGLVVHWSLELGVGDRGWARALGRGALTNMMMMLLPITKTSLWSRVLGLSYDRAVKFHVFLSVYTMASVIAHFIFSSSLQPIFSFLPMSSTRVVPGYGTAAFIIFAVVASTAHSTIRRRSYEVFKYSHYLTLVGLVLLVLHVPYGWQYLIAPVGLWVLDTSWRSIRSARRRVMGTLRALPGGLTALHIGDMAGAAPPGAFYFLCVPAASLLQWHPVSVCVGLTPQTDFVIKAGAPGSWSAKLRDLATQGGSGDEAKGQDASELRKDVAVLLDGPYGTLSFDLEDYSHLLCFAGGIGITPITTLLDRIVKERGAGRLKRLEHVRLVWVCRQRDILTTFSPILATFRTALLRDQEKQGRDSLSPPMDLLTVQLYVTQHGQDDSSADNDIDSAGVVARVKAPPTPLGPGIASEQGRPDMASIFESVIPSKDNNSNQMAVFCCGPSPMFEEVQRSAVKLNLALHLETFSW
jgi:predicted ferric reductase